MMAGLPRRTEEFATDALSADAAQGCRLIAPLFAMVCAALMVRSVGEATNTFSLVVATPPSDALNPFRPRYHPDHGQGVAVARHIAMEFLPMDTEIAGLPAWGGYCAGRCLAGADRRRGHHPVHVEGHFLLRRIADVATLNDGQ